MTPDNPFFDAMPFIVPDDHLMFCQIPAPDAGKVLTLERLFHSWTIYEYTDPLYRARQWQYDDEQSGGFATALTALIEYWKPALALLPATHPPTEPVNWTRAIDWPNGTYRVRRQRFQEDGTWFFIDATEDEPQ